MSRTVEVYAIYDRKVREYGNLLLAANRDVIMRDVQVGVVGSGSLMEKYPEDFELHYMGYFDRALGHLEAAEGRPEVVVQMRDLVGIRPDHPLGAAHLEGQGRA